MFNRLVIESRQLMIYKKHTILTAHDIQTAVKLILPSELGKYAMSEGTKAIMTYNDNKSSDNEKLSKK